MSPGLVRAGEPSGFLSVGCSIFCRSPSRAPSSPPLLSLVGEDPLAGGRRRSRPRRRSPWPSGRRWWWCRGRWWWCRGRSRCRRSRRCRRSGGGSGALYSSVSSGPEQPGSARSTAPSPSSSARFEQAGEDRLGRGVHLEAVDGDRRRGARRDDRERGAEGDG